MKFEWRADRCSSISLPSKNTANGSGVEDRKYVREKYIPIFVINIEVKTLNQILSNSTDTHQKDQLPWSCWHWEYMDALIHKNGKYNKLYKLIKENITF